MRDRYLEILIENQSYILMLYEKFADKKPVMLYDIQERRIYAVPYREYRATLSKRSQIALKKQYERAMADGDIVVFVKDNEKENSYRTACRCDLRSGIEWAASDASRPSPPHALAGIHRTGGYPGKQRPDLSRGRRRACGRPKLNRAVLAGIGGSGGKAARRAPRN